MNGDVTVCTWAVIDEGASVTCVAEGSGQANILFGQPPGHAFEVMINSEVLRELVRAGGEAVAEMDARYAQENPDER